MKNNKTLFKQTLVTIAAALCLNTALAQTSAFIDLTQEFYVPIMRSPKIVLPEEVTITGLVKNEDGTALTNAKVRAASGENILTDNNGGFSFKLKKGQVTAQSLFVGYDGLVTAARSYDPVMANTSYDIILYKPTSCCKKKHYDSTYIKPIEVTFKSNSSKLSEDTKKELDKITGTLKNDPSATVRLIAHTANRKTLIKIAEVRLDAIRKYFIEQKGISADRIKVERVTDDKNTIEIKAE